MANLTSADSTSGYITAYPCDAPRPIASNLSTQGTYAVANFAMVPTAADGSICLYSERDTHLIVDITGYIVESAP